MSRLSVLIAFYNPGGRIVDTVRSVKAALADIIDSEIVLVDDGSTDESKDLCQDLFGADSTIRLLSLQSNRGLSYALRFGMTFCRYEYIARIDSGDIIINSKSLYRKVRFLERNRDYALVGSHTLKASSGRLDHRIFSLFLTRDTLVSLLLSLLNPFVHSTIVARRSMVMEVGNYDASFKTCQDYDLWVRLSNSYKVKVLVGDDIVAEDSPYSISKSKRLIQLEDHAKIICRTLVESGHSLLTKDEVRLIVGVVVFGLVPEGTIRERCRLYCGILYILKSRLFRITRLRQKELDLAIGSIFCMPVAVLIIIRHLITQKKNMIKSSR